MLAESPQNADVLVTLRSFDAALQSAPAHDVEVILAFLAITTAERVKEGLVSPAEADRLFTLIDVHLTDSKRAQELSEEALDLITEGEHFEHYGEAYGTDLERLQQLARTILRPAHPQQP